MVKFPVKYLFLLMLISGLCQESMFAQRWKLKRYEVGGGIGAMQLFGDIGGTASESNWFGLKDISIDEMSYAAGANARYKITPFVGVRANINYGKGHGDDADSRNDRGRSYQTTLFEFSGQVEYYFLREDKGFRSSAIYTRRGMINNYNSFAAYAFAGLGAAYSISSHADAPMAPYDSYKKNNIAPVIPFGVGVKYILDESSYINIDLGYRFGLNDYIEGYKQTQASRFTDVYYFLMFSYNYRLKTTRRNLPAFLDSKYRKYGY